MTLTLPVGHRGHGSLRTLGYADCTRGNSGTHDVSVRQLSEDETMTGVNQRTNIRGIDRRGSVPDDPLDYTYKQLTKSKPP